MNKVALITGITGQDGSYLAEFLIHKGYKVHGIIRRSSSFNTERIEHLYINELIRDLHSQRKVTLHYGDMTDSTNLIRLIQEIKPGEIYNLAAQSHVKVSFDLPEYTAETDAVGTLRLLEAVRICGLVQKTRIYQASTSELYGKVQETPQTETTSFYPRSPYGVAKIYAFWITKNYREAYNIFACNGILFNHESPRRGETFVTKKIISALCKIKEGKQKKLFLGNLNAKRDWGHARDYCEAMWKILQQKNPEDYVIATGVQYSIKQFINLTAKKLNMKIVWKGNGIKEKALDKRGRVIIECDKNYFRPLDVNTLLGDARKARKKLKWKPKEDINSLIEEMIKSEYQLLDFK